MERAPNREVIVLGADHNGVHLKSKVKKFLQETGLRCVDLGAYDVTPSVDYVDYAGQLGRIMQSHDADRGILICGTGVGMSIVANRYPGVRAALVHNPESARKSREHNDSDVLCLGAWMNDDDMSLEIVSTWLNEKFGEHRHVRRVEKMVPHGQEDIVLANGVFDILHIGHIDLLKFAKSLGGRLVVAINSDQSVKRIKGDDRPVNREADRKAVLQSIKYVDEVIVFDDEKPTALIETLQPQIVVKGGEWTADEIRRRDQVPEHITIKVFPLVSGYSSTHTIKHIRKE
jgi:ribose 5-phosphate isomerase B